MTDTAITPATWRVPTVPVLAALAVTAVLCLMLALSSLPAALVAVVIAATAVLAWVVDRRPIWFVGGITVYMLFESVILARAPVGDTVFLYGQFVGEASIYLALLVLAAGKLLRGEPWRRTPLELPLLALLAVMLLSIVVNRAPIINSLLNVRSLLRYVALYYLVVNLDLKPRQVAQLLWVIVAVGGVQLALGFMQVIGGNRVDRWLMPRQVYVPIFGQVRKAILVTRGREFGSVFGSLGDTVYFGLFLLHVFAIGLARVRRLRWWHVVPLAVVVVGVAYSYSRAAVIAVVWTVLVYLAMRLGLRRAALVTAVLALAATLVLIAADFRNRSFKHPREQQQSAWANLTGVLSPGYIERAKAQRLGSLIGTAPTALYSRPVLGYGPSQDFTIERLNDAQPNFLYKMLTDRGFEDVYWVAILCYYGIVGVAVVAWLLVRLGRACWDLARRADDPTTQWCAAAATIIIAQTPLLLLFSRVLEFRVYSMFFWMMPALAFALAAQGQRDGRRSI